MWRSFLQPIRFLHRHFILYPLIVVGIPLTVVGLFVGIGDYVILNHATLQTLIGILCVLVVVRGLLRCFSSEIAAFLRPLTVHLDPVYDRLQHVPLHLTAGMFTACFGFSLILTAPTHLMSGFVTIVYDSLGSSSLLIYNFNNFFLYEIFGGRSVYAVLQLIIGILLILRGFYRHAKFARWGEVAPLTPTMTLDIFDLMDPSERS